MRKEIGALLLATAAITGCQQSSAEISSKPEISRFGKDAFLLAGDIDKMRTNVIRLQAEGCKLEFPYTITSFSTAGYGQYPTASSMLVYTSTPSCAPEIQ